MAETVLVSVNPKIGDFAGNSKKILSFLQQALSSGSALVVFPELCVSGYPPLDLLDRQDFIEAHEEALQKLVEEMRKFLAGKKAACVFGAFRRNPAVSGRRLFNAALIVTEAGIVFEQHKKLLPEYDVFDEGRYFEPGSETKLWDGGALGKIGLSICEDAWFEDERAETGRRHKLYEADPALELAKLKPDLVFNLSASPFEAGKSEKRKALFAAFAKRVGAPVYFVNQVGAQDELVFDGGALHLSATGEVLGESARFVEGIAEFGEGEPGRQAIGQSGNREAVGGMRSAVRGERDGVRSPSSEIFSALTLGIQDYFQKSGFQKAVIGLSGGIDSTLVAVLAAKALGPENVIGVAMPGPFSSSHSIEDAEALAQNLGLRFQLISIKFIYSSLKVELKPLFQGDDPASKAAAEITSQNLQARLRGMTLMSLANRLGALTLTTGNKSELAVGYCTTYGDMAGALAPLGDLYKTKVYELCRWINSQWNCIPPRVLEKPPSAELAPDQKDEDSLGSYDKLDQFLVSYLEKSESKAMLIKAGFEEAYIEKITKLVRNSEFKRRQAAPVIKLTSKAFGIGRRVPVVRGF